MSYNKWKHISDEDLLEKYFTNNYESEWLGILLHRYTLLLYGVCLKYLKNEADAKDAVQQIFLKVLSNFKNYKVNFFGDKFFNYNICLPFNFIKNSAINVKFF